MFIFLLFYFSHFLEKTSHVKCLWCHIYSLSCQEFIHQLWNTPNISLKRFSFSVHVNRTKGKLWCMSWGVFGIHLFKKYLPHALLLHGVADPTINKKKKLKSSRILLQCIACSTSIKPINVLYDIIYQKHNLNFKLQL